MALELVIHPVVDGSLWAWKLLDGDRVVESSWDSWWIAYPTPAEAEAAARIRRAVLGAVAA
jgi:hypothetical protein